MEIICVDNCGGCSASVNKLLVEFACDQKSIGSDYCRIIQRVSEIDTNPNRNSRVDTNSLKPPRPMAEDNIVMRQSRSIVNGKSTYSPTRYCVLEIKKNRGKAAKKWKEEMKEFTNTPQYRGIRSN